ncbi:flavin reductase family protein [Kineococcus sp. NUM-3379]
MSQSTLARPRASAEQVPTLRQLFGTHAGAVAVITADGGTGPAGFTATSVSSLSLEPALLVFNVSHTSSSWDAVRNSATAAVHFLDEEQAGLARRFATSGVDRFAAPTRWSRLADGTPVLDDAPVAIAGPVEHRFTAGDHTIVAVRITWAEIRRPHSPLLHHAGRYHGLGVEAAAPARDVAP